MSTLTWPSALRPSESSFAGAPSIVETASPFSGGSVAYELAGSRWVASLSFGLLDTTSWRLLQGFVAALRGPINRVALPDHAYPGARGTASGTITATADAYALEIALSGISGTLLLGDRLGIGGRLYMVTADVTASMGAATVGVWPAMRADLSAEAVTLAAPTCLMQLTQPYPQFSYRVPSFASVDLSFREALP